MAEVSIFLSFQILLYLNRASNSVTLKKRLADGYHLRLMMTKIWTPRDPVSGSKSISKTLRAKESAHKAFGETKTACATGEE